MANGKEYDVMGYWDCPVCLDRRRLKEQCGTARTVEHRVGKDVRFYMDGARMSV